MAKEICISSTPHETRLAILEDDQLAEIYYERENEYTLAGSIYNGRVTRVLPGMQSAFVDLGLERDAFLYVTDFMELEDPEETDELGEGSGQRRQPGSARGSAPATAAAAARARGRAGNSARTRPAPESAGQRKKRSTETPGSDCVRCLSRPRLRNRQRRPGSDGEGSAQAHAAGADAGIAAEAAAGPASPKARQSPAVARNHAGAAVETEIAPEIQASAIRSGRRPAAHSSAPHAPRRRSQRRFRLFCPANRSRSTAAPRQRKQQSLQPEPAAPVRPAGFSKPSTLIEAPIEWDGSGLLPGESISRHRTPARRNLRAEAVGGSRRPKHLTAKLPTAWKSTSLSKRLRSSTPSRTELRLSSKRARRKKSLLSSETGRSSRRSGRDAGRRRASVDAQSTAQQIAEEQLSRAAHELESSEPEEDASASHRH